MDARANRTRRRWLALAIDLVIVLVYLFFVTGGRMTHWPGWHAIIDNNPRWYEIWGGGYYDDLAKAFAHGQTYLLIEPAPELLALLDPYDYQANVPYRLHDSILYNGHFYLYWGPVPALLIVPLEWMGVRTVGDSQLTFAFLCGALFFGTLFLLSLWDRLFASAPWWTMAPAVLALGLGSALTFLLAPPLMYQAAISGGQCFLLAAIYWIFTGLAPDRAVSWRLGLGGACIALACGARISLVMAAFFLTVMVLWRMVRSYRKSSIWAVLAPVLCFGLPPLFGVLGLAAYNHIRFGSWTEMGVHYQLYEANHLDLDPVLTSADYLLPNIYNYFFRPFRFEHSYPYLRLDNPGDPSEYPGFIALSPYFTWSDGPVVGMLCAFPFMGFALFAGRLAFGWLRGRLRHKSGATTGTSGLLIKRYPIGWLMGTILGVAPLAIAAPLLMCGTVTRYYADVAPCLILAGAVGFGCTYHAVRDKPKMRYLVWLAGSGLAYWSAVVGVLLTMMHWNPEWFKDWSALLYLLPNDHAAQNNLFYGLIASSVILALAAVLVPLLGPRDPALRPRIQATPVRAPSDSNAHGRHSSSARWKPPS